MEELLTQFLLTMLQNQGQPMQNQPVQSAQSAQSAQGQQAKQNAQVQQVQPIAQAQQTQQIQQPYSQFNSQINPPQFQPMVLPQWGMLNNNGNNNNNNNNVNNNNTNSFLGLSENAWLTIANLLGTMAGNKGWGGALGQAASQMATNKLYANRTQEVTNPNINTANF